MNQQNRNLLIVLGVIVAILLLGPLLMGGVLGAGGVGPGMMGWGYTGGNTATSGNGWVWGLAMGVGGLMMLAFWGAIIVGIVLFVRWIAGQGSGTTSTAGTTASTATEAPLTILQRRYAAGEIDQQTYERMRAELDEFATRPRETGANWPGASSDEADREPVGVTGDRSGSKSSISAVRDGPKGNDVKQDGWPR